jgi:hypothetical protein
VAQYEMDVAAQWVCGGSDSDVVAQLGISWFPGDVVAQLGMWYLSGDVVAQWVGNVVAQLAAGMGGIC